MKRNHSLIIIFALVAFFIVSCSSSDMARVTINLGIPPQAKAYAPTLFDRIVALVSFSTRVEAETPSDISLITIAVLSGGSQVAGTSITSESADWTAGQTTLDVPAGGPYTIAVRGIFVGKGTNSIYGGISSLVSVSGGDEITIPIQMGELPLPGNNFGFSSVVRSNDQQGTPRNYIGFGSEGNVIAYILYRSTHLDGPYQRIATIPGELSEYYDYNINPENIHYYKLSAYNEFGESDMTGYFSDESPPLPQ